MSRFVYILILLGLHAIAYGQDAGKEFNLSQTTAKALGAAKAANFVQLSYDPANVKTLERQVAIWEQVVKTEAQDANNWLNYYMAARLYFLQSNSGTVGAAGRKKLASVAFQMDSAIKTPAKQSFEKSLIYYFEEENWDKASIHLQNAHKLYGPDMQQRYPEINTFLLPELARYYEFKNDIKQRNDVCAKINKIAPGTAIYEFAKAQINTLPDSSVIITNGDYDTYALWLAANNADKKITVLSLKLLENKEYCKQILLKTGLAPATFDAGDKKAFLEQLLKNNPGKKSYVSLTVNNLYLANLGMSLYNTGVCYLYSPYAIDNISILYKNLVEKELFATIPGSENAVLKNCMPGYIILYRHYKDNDKSRAGKVADKAESLAKKAGFWAEYKKYFDR